MRRGNRKWTDATIDKKIKEGHGQGEGADYIPWTTIHDFNSSGWDRSYMGKKTKRRHHLFSNYEFYYCLLLDWSDYVVDIRERYPLFSNEETVRIAESLNLKHKTNQESGVPYVLTSDFFIVTNFDGVYQNKVRTVIESINLERKEVIEKFEIERSYWESRDIDWGIVTEKELPMDIVNNLIWLEESWELNNIIDFSESDISTLIDILKEKIQAKESTIYKLTASLDKQYRVETGTFLHLFKHLVFKKELRIDIRKPIKIAKMETSEVELE
jgi:hypothetical protein